MNSELFIAKRIIFSGTEKRGFSRPIVKIAIWGIALGMAVMIITLAVVNGFQKEIRDKIIGFGSHIQLSSYDTNNSQEASPVYLNDTLLRFIQAIPGVNHVQAFAVKAGIIKSQDDLLGVVVKGIGKDFDWNFFKRSIVEGSPFTVADSGVSNKILISRFIANKLKLKTGDKFKMYFIQDNQQRQRAFRVSGIYETGLEGFDNVIVFADIRHVQKLNNWNNHEVAGYEVLLNDFRKMDVINEKINDELSKTYPDTLSNDSTQRASVLESRTIRERNPQIFNWLDFTDTNAAIIISLMLFVAVINMTSALLILILERTNMIGLLKAMGARNGMVQRIFLINAAWLIGQGLLIGNIIGITLSLIQAKTHFIPLNQESYYMPYVPIHIDVVSLIGVNILTLLVCLLVLLLPSIIISRITPLKAIRFS